LIIDKKLPQDILNRLLHIKQSLEIDKRIAALYLFGSAVTKQLKPLSDIDFAVLLESSFSRDQMNAIHLEIIGKVSEILGIDEFDLVLLNTAPARFGHIITSNGEIIFCNSKAELINYIEKNNLEYLDFSYYKNQFNSTFQSKYGIV
jgi:predicted nucleotidyltransferase